MNRRFESGKKDGVTMYVIQATVTTEHPDGYCVTNQIPTFFLDENVQGITSEDGACRVASEIIDPFDQWQTSIQATKL